MSELSKTSYSAAPCVIDHATRVLNDKMCNVNGHNVRFSELKQRLATHEFGRVWELEVRFRSVPWRATDRLPSLPTDEDLEKHYAALALEWVGDPSRVKLYTEYLRLVDNGHWAALLFLVARPALKLGMADWSPMRVDLKTGAACFCATVALPWVEMAAEKIDPFSASLERRTVRIHTGMLPPDHCAPVTFLLTSSDDGGGGDHPAKKLLFPDARFAPAGLPESYKSLMTVSMPSFRELAPPDDAVRAMIQETRRWREEAPMDAAAFCQASRDLNRVLQGTGDIKEAIRLGHVCKNVCPAVASFAALCGGEDRRIGPSDEAGRLEDLLSKLIKFDGHPQAAALGVEEIILHVRKPRGVQIQGCCVCVEKITVVMTGDKLDTLYQTNAFTGRFFGGNDENGK